MAKKTSLLKITFETPPIFIVERELEKKLKKLKDIKKGSEIK